MERTRKEYLVLRSDQAGEAGIVGVFSSRRKAKAATQKDITSGRKNSSYWLLVLPEDRPIEQLYIKDSDYGRTI